jgi:5-methylcytosine-specific restriction endonuclease McrA
VSKSWAGGSTRGWRRTRAFVLWRDGHSCQLKIEGVCERVATHVHHTHGKAAGDDPRYLVASCPPCNLKTGDPARATDPPAIPITRW